MVLVFCGIHTSKPSVSDPRSMKTSMLSDSKLILEKVSFDRKLFWKEYRKFVKLLEKPESNELRDWVRAMVR